jgi:subtilisin family serine protease
MYSLSTRRADGRFGIPFPSKARNSATPLELVHLDRLMAVTTGSAEVKIGLIDGPIALNHPALSAQNIREIPGKLSGSCARAGSSACIHGTFVAGILTAKRESGAPAIAPQCTLLVRPIFSEDRTAYADMPRARPEELAAAMIDTVNEGARVINLSAALLHGSPGGESRLGAALDYASQRGVVVVAAAGNQSSVGSSAITRHPWVIPVAACNIQGRPLGQSNLGSSIGRRGLSAPGENIVSLSTSGGVQTFAGTSAAAPFVTGAIALLFSRFPNASAAQIKLAVTQAGIPRRSAIAPPVLDAWEAYESLAAVHLWRRVS